MTRPFKHFFIFGDSITYGAWDNSKTYKNEFVKTYNAALREFTQQNNIPFIDLFTPLSKINIKSITDDGIHPNTKGHQKMFLIIKTFLQKKNII